MKRALILLSALAACDEAPSFRSTCTVPAPSAEALIPASRLSSGSVILPGGRRLTPAGRVLDVGGFPLGMRVLPGGRYVVVTDGHMRDQALRLVDLQAADPAAPVISEVAYLGPHGYAEDRHPELPALFYGLALTADGSRLYVSNGGSDPVPAAQPPASHYNTVEVYDLVGTPPKLQKNEALTIKLMFAQDTARLPAGLALSSDEKLLYVACQNDNSLAIVDVAPGASFGSEIGRAGLPGLGPYDVAVDEPSHTAFVSLWGGSGRGPTAVDGVALVDVTNPRAPVALPEVLGTPKAAEAELLVGGKLYVASADGDAVSVVDAASRAVRSQRVGASMILGASPNHLAVDVARGRLYIANGNENAVVALDLETLEVKGRIPSAQYPTAVAVLPDGSLVIASAKGMGAGRPFDPAGLAMIEEHQPESYLRGTLQLVPPPTDADFSTGSAEVMANLERPRSYQATPTCQGEPRFTLPLSAGGETPIKQVFLVVRENKTYDAILGDLKGSNGDPSLVMFGEEVTPNTHALARSFVNLDNFYSHAEASLQGHQWTTASISNDYTEKAWQATWGRGYRTLSAFASGGFERLGAPGSDTIFVHLDKANIAYHNYGELAGTVGSKLGFDGQFPGIGYNLNIPDVEKAQYVLDTITSAGFVLEPFSYVLLPDDHTLGTTPGKPTPQSMVAENDEAVGRLIDGISRSKWWASSIVFVLEDDPRDGGDHVERHRTVGMVISPWVKRGYVSHVHYDLPAVYRTVALLLGTEPMNQYDANAPAMYDLFTTTADLSPYTFIPRRVQPALNTADAPLAEESLRIDFSRPDEGDLGRILWKATHGVDAEPPWAAGAPDDDD